MSVAKSVGSEKINHYPERLQRVAEEMCDACGNVYPPGTGYAMSNYIAAGAVRSGEGYVGATRR